MIKALLIVGVIVAVLMLGGVLEVRLHPEEISNVPGRVLSFVSSPQVQAKVRTSLTSLKRRGEQMIIRDKEKRVQLALLYVKEDARHVQELLAEEQADVAQVMPYVELLATSMQRAKSELESAPIDVVAGLKETSRESLQEALTSFALLNEHKERYEVLQEKFAQLTGSLEESIAGLVANSGQPPEVAGDNATPTPTQPVINAVPLNF